ncbi:hypothetical protein TNCV_422761 [Trichonephila clavipes]|nr:hypothetical protein TNCV_422761 [Trichonephila clavipes]
MLQVRRFGSNEELIAKVEVYFESKDKLFYGKVHNTLAPIRGLDVRFEPTVPLNETHPVIYFIPIGGKISCSHVNPMGTSKTPSPLKELSLELDFWMSAIFSY